MRDHKTDAGLHATSSSLWRDGSLDRVPESGDCVLGSGAFASFRGGSVCPWWQVARLENVDGLASDFCFRFCTVGAEIILSLHPHQPVLFALTILLCFARTPDGHPLNLFMNDLLVSSGSGASGP